MREGAGFLEKLFRIGRLPCTDSDNSRVKKQSCVLRPFCQGSSDALLCLRQTPVRQLRPRDGVVRENIGPRGKLLACEMECEGGLLAARGQKEGERSRVSRCASTLHPAFNRAGFSGTARRLQRIAELEAQYAPAHAQPPEGNGSAT